MQAMQQSKHTQGTRHASNARAKIQRQKQCLISTQDIQVSTNRNRARVPCAAYVTYLTF